MRRSDRRVPSSARVSSQTREAQLMSGLIPLLWLSTVQASDTHAVARQNPPAICSRQRTDVSDPTCQSRERQRGLELLKTSKKDESGNQETKKRLNNSPLKIRGFLASRLIH